MIDALSSCFVISLCNGSNADRYLNSSFSLLRRDLAASFDLVFFSG